MAVVCDTEILSCSVKLWQAYYRVPPRRRSYLGVHLFAVNYSTIACSRPSVGGASGGRARKK